MSLDVYINDEGEVLTEKDLELLDDSDETVEYFGSSLEWIAEAHSAQASKESPLHTTDVTSYFR